MVPKLSSYFFYVLCPSEIISPSCAVPAWLCLCWLETACIAGWHAAVQLHILMYLSKKYITWYLFKSVAKLISIIHFKRFFKYYLIFINMMKIIDENHIHEHECDCFWYLTIQCIFLEQISNCTYSLILIECIAKTFINNYIFRNTFINEII